MVLLHQSSVYIISDLEWTVLLSLVVFCIHSMTIVLKWVHNQ